MPVGVSTSMKFREAEIPEEAPAEYLQMTVKLISKDSQ